MTHHKLLSGIIGCQMASYSRTKAKQITRYTPAISCKPLFQEILLTGMGANPSVYPAQRRSVTL